MAETATPTPGPEAISESSFDAKLAKLVDTKVFSEIPAEPEPQPEPATADALDGDLSAEDLKTTDEPAPDGEWLEIERKGEKRRLTKDEARIYAQKGLDADSVYAEARAEKEALKQEREALRARAALSPQLLDAAAGLKLYGQALQQYQSVDWGRLARDNPTEYLPARAQFEQLREQFAQAQAQFAQVSSAVQKADVAVDQAELMRQSQIVAEQAPELRDPQRLATETGRMRGYLAEIGFSDAEMNNLVDARYFRVVRDAARYAQAAKAKAERGKDTASLRPGAAPERVSAKEQERRVVTKLHQTKDPAQKKALFDAALAAKLSRLA